MMVKFTKDELKHLLISFILVSLFTAVHITNKFHWTTNEFINVMLLTLIVFTISLILRTYLQKKVALNYRYTIQYKFYSYGIIFSLVTMIFSIIVLVPGYFDYGVYSRMISDEEKFKISSVGPIFNIVLAVIFMILVFALKSLATLGSFDVNGILLLFALIGFNVNSYLGFFDLIPFMVTDGLNMVEYSTVKWLVLLVISGMLTALSFTNFIL